MRAHSAADHRLCCEACLKVMQGHLHAGYVPLTGEELEEERQRRAAKKTSDDGEMLGSASLEGELELLEHV